MYVKYNNKICLSKVLKHASKLKITVGALYYSI